MAEDLIEARCELYLLGGKVGCAIMRRTTGPRDAELLFIRLWPLLISFVVLDRRPRLTSIKVGVDTTW